jgi:hypothetical protein
LSTRLKWVETFFPATGLMDFGMVVSTDDGLAQRGAAKGDI